ncbi:acetylglutamate kinase [Alteromonas aestuariivivens]|uniref:Acetylglutamate kinase n=1 Tax=Alteromonas aestuariivivens TaxID=1938339 RepID=A0A3D8MAY3_9ALTE|nr:acetylglutamate kinase [Alteromonas aestuariivivens]RDV26858.1 acetylglutamate kinase [Alteromonas aestuariivivens]
MTLSPIVIKVGGALMEDAAATALLSEIKAVSANRPVVLVHGGGPLVESLMAALQLESKKIDGLRVTPDEHMPYICGALAGSANKALCGLAVSCQLTPVGLSLLDGNLVKCEAIDPIYGAVGTPQANNPALLELLMQQGMLPVISSIGCDSAGRLLNINADQAATVIAQLVNGELLLLSNVEGVLNQDKQLLGSLTAGQIEQLVCEQVITDGMKVKTDAALLAASTLQRPVTIASWAAPLSAILNEQTGTRIQPNTGPSGEAQ